MYARERSITWCEKIKNMLLLPLPTLAVSVNTKVMRVLPKYFFVVLYDKKMVHGAQPRTAQ